ncbi:hypothetical protein BN1708_019219, partial [Verticillium longisporum]
ISSGHDRSRLARPRPRHGCLLLPCPLAGRPPLPRRHCHHAADLGRAPAPVPAPGGPRAPEAAKDKVRQGLCQLRRRRPGPRRVSVPTRLAPCQLAYLLPHVAPHGQTAQGGPPLAAARRRPLQPRRPRLRRRLLRPLLHSHRQ